MVANSSTCCGADNTTEPSSPQVVNVVGVHLGTGNRGKSPPCASSGGYRANDLSESEKAIFEALSCDDIVNAGANDNTVAVRVQVLGTIGDCGRSSRRDGIPVACQPARTFSFDDTRA